MGKHSKLGKVHQQFIEHQHIFFVATAAESGTINLSPKGMNSLRVLDEKTIVWLNLTGSGNETAAHVKRLNRMTIMFCSFDEKPLILRLYGSAETYHDADEQFKTYSKLFPNYSGQRQIFKMSIELVQSSCGFGVPLMDYVSERTDLVKWSDKKGPVGIKAYQAEKNKVSLDGFDTGL